MHLLFLVPTIHDRPTGGNIYNRRMIEELSREMPTEVVRWKGERSTLPPVDASEEVIVVDSLLLRRDEGLRALRDARSSARFVLLAHYLHCIDPHERASAPAAAERAVLDWFDGAITTSRYAKEAMVDEGMSADRVHVVPPGLDARHRAPVSFASSSDIPRLLTVANLVPGKGLQGFVDVLESLEDEAWTWTLVGDEALDPDYAEAFSERLRASSIAERVQRPGVLSSSALRDRYDRADVFVLPSRFETCSMATREAMARGCPVVGYAVGGLPENIGAAEAGRLVSLDAPEALAAALRPLIVDTERRAQMGRAAQARSRSFPSWAEAAARFRSSLEALWNAP